jgi:hypothetical protein
VPGALRNVAKICEERENLFLVENTSFVVDGVRIVGATLWAHIPDRLVNVVNYRMNDYRMIGGEDDHKAGEYHGYREQAPLHPNVTRKWHADSVQFIKEQLALAAEVHQPVLVLSHHAPLDMNSFGATRPGRSVCACACLCTCVCVFVFFWSVSCVLECVCTCVCVCASVHVYMCLYKPRASALLVFSAFVIHLLVCAVSRRMAPIRVRREWL